MPLSKRAVITAFRRAKSPIPELPRKPPRQEGIPVRAIKGGRHDSKRDFGRNRRRLILLGGLLAHFTQTTNGIRIEDVRFKGAKGNTMSALVYIPANATEKTPAPGILAVHGYLNSRETQDGFAIAAGNFGDYVGCDPPRRAS